MARKKRTIYNNDSTIVEESARFSDSVSVIKKESEQSAYSYYGFEMSVDDIFDTFSGYLIPRLKVSGITNQDNQFEEEGNKCLVCGEPTNQKNRKLCFSCMSKYRNSLYSKMIDILRAENKTISF